jgi:fumarate hydratase class II
VRNDDVTDTEYRIEHDTMGEVRVPKNALYAAQTQRAVENFPISGDPLEAAQIVALARIKKAAALANKELGTLDGAIADAIAGAADRIIAGEFADQFPIDVYQTGSGTSSNMNMNEVLATLATQSLGATVHPNDHVNASQSSNDVFPTSVHIAVTQELIDDLIPALDHLAVALEAKAEEWKTVVKSGRTHLMDATPVTLGQEFGGYARQMRLGIERVQAVLPRVAEVPLGGTAVGTGINTPLGFPQRVIELIVADTELPITEAKDHFEAQANRDGLVEASGALRTIAVSLTKINNDLRWICSPARRSCRARSTPSCPRRRSWSAHASSATTPPWPGQARPVPSSSTWRSPSWAPRCSSRSSCSPTPRDCSPTGRSPDSGPMSSAPRPTPACRRRSSRR